MFGLDLGKGLRVDLGHPIIGPLRNGSRGEGVRLVQGRLNELLAPGMLASATARAAAAVLGAGQPSFVPLIPDGAFGAKTTAAVIRFQKTMQLQTDGVVGPVTAKKLGFTRYTTLRRALAGLGQFASTAGGMFGNLVPRAHAELDLTYTTLLAAHMHVGVLLQMATVLAPIGDALAISNELRQIHSTMAKKLAQARNHQFEGMQALLARSYADMAFVRLLALTQRLELLARQQTLLPKAMVDSVIAVIEVQMMALRMQASILRQGQPQLQADPADEMLKIAAKVLQSAKRMLPSA